MFHILITRNSYFLGTKSTFYTDGGFWGSWRLSESHLITNMREQQRLRGLRKIFEPEQQKVRGDRRKMRNGKLHTLYCSSTTGWLNQQNGGSAGHGAHTGQRRGAYGILVGKTEGKRPLGWPRCRWEDNIKLNLQETDWGEHGLDYSSSGQSNLLGFCEHANEISGSMKCMEFPD